MVPPIIDHLKLKVDEVIIITDRSQTSAAISPDLHTENADFRALRKRWRTLPQDWITIIHNSIRIGELVNGQEYIAYLPSPSDGVCQQILWHPLCKQYWLIEEGLGSYCSPGVSPVHLKPLSNLQKLHLQIGTRLRGLGRISPTATDYPHWPSKYAGCFGSNDLTFPNFPQPVIHLNLSLYQAKESPITRLVVLDDFSIFNLRLQAIYLDTIRQTISAEHCEGDVWAYKLHPRCAAWPSLLAETKKAFQDTLPPDAFYEALEPDTSVEDIGISSKVTTYGYMSSCLFYIHHCGGRVASFKHILENQDPEFHELWQRFFPPMLESLVSDYRIL